MDDIEDIQNKNIDFLKELLKHNFTSDKHYNEIFKNIRKQIKICPSKPTLRKLYKELLLENKIKENISFYKYSIKKKGKSISGVSVITIVTSPNPKYTNINNELVEQSFTCSKNCAYCPNEPEIIINLKIKEINNNIIFITTNDDISLIRVISYIQKENKKYDVIDSFNFTKTSFKIKLENIDNLNIGDNIIGYKSAQPRSYLSTEPAIIRANRNKFDAVLQIYDREQSLSNCGHIVDKIEIIVLGGTWDHYPLEYQNEFIRDIYYGVNTITNHRNKLNLEEEIEMNETAKRKLIGLTLETRPDCINLKTIKKYRKFNVTRLQIGVQHIDNDVLKFIERGCYNEDTVESTYLWKQNGGKIDWHLMPDLPGSSFEKDLEMFKNIFGVSSIVEITKNYFIYDIKHPELQPDQFKIYPCQTTQWTKIHEWYNDGIYKPYSEDEEKLTEIIKYIESNIFPWQRLNRIIRDIPNQNIIGGNKIPNLRQKINNPSNCIRYREVKDNIENIDKAELVVREYNGVKSTEYFISYESPDKKLLYGFLRLRINYTNDDLIFKELNDCSHIRELHVYGPINYHKDKNNNSIQHIGIGKKLLKKAEDISFINDIYKISIISGVGVREYYKKQGYYLHKNYMFKDLCIKKEEYYFFYIRNKIYNVIIIFLIIYILFYQ